MARSSVCGSILFLAAVCATADTITVKGKTYEDVLVNEGTSMYYVRLPKTGEVLNVPKDDVDREAIVINHGRRYRADLRKEFAKNRTRQAAPESVPVKPATSAASPEKRDAPENRYFERNGIVALPRRNGAPVFTSNPDKYLQKKAGRSIFVNRTGVPYFTNLKGNYRGQEEYVEVALHLDVIKVDNKYRKFKSPTDYTNATIAQLVREYAKFYGLDEDLIFAVIRAESAFDPMAVSPAGARGLMQLMPGTALEMGVTDIFDPAQNIAGGTQYLSRMLNLFDNDPSLALAAYNAGPGAVKKYGGVPPYKETQNYIKIVERFRQEFKNGRVDYAYLAKAHRVDRSFLPSSSGSHHTIVLRNGWTQPADDILVGESGYYIARFQGRETRVKKSDVTKIIRGEKA